MIILKSEKRPAPKRLVPSYLVQVHVNDDYVDDAPTHAHIFLDKKLLARLYKLRKAVKAVNVAFIGDWDVTPTLLTDEDISKEWDGSPDSMHLNVTAQNFQWIWYIKHTNIECSTERIDFSELSENLKVLRAKITDLPRLAVIELKNESSKVLVEKRLKGV